MRENCDKIILTRGGLDMIFQGIVEKKYKKKILSRRDGREGVFLFSASDFEGLYEDELTFKSRAGRTLWGAFYHREVKFNDRVIIFDHGLGSGRRAYMREIDLLTSHGFLVFSYDHTGCMRSEGESVPGLAQAICDLDDCIRMLKEHPLCKGKRLCVIGHSWGGYSTMNITALHPDIHQIVVLSGFVSVERMMEQNMRGPLKPYRSHICDVEREALPDFYHYDASKSLKATNIPALLIYSDDDKTVTKKYNYDILYSELCEKDNIRFILKHARGHNPNYTDDAVRYKRQFFAELKKRINKLRKSPEKLREFTMSYDWYRMNEQDMELWEEIFKSLEH